MESVVFRKGNKNKNSISEIMSFSAEDATQSFEFLEKLVSLGPRPFSSRQNILARRLLIDSIKQILLSTCNQDTCDFNNTDHLSTTSLDMSLISFNGTTIGDRSTPWMTVLKFPSPTPSHFSLNVGNIFVKVKVLSFLHPFLPQYNIYLGQM
jgi:hypothetical protein